jgi:hypothetical protein
MKNLIIALGILLTTLSVKAQQQLAFPFQGGKQVMMDYFKNNIKINPDIAKKAATGLVVFKFTADQNGAIKKIIVYYADDLLLTQPLIDAIKQSDRKWIIPDKEKLHDFIIPFSISFNAPATGSAAAQKALYSYYTSRKPVISYDQVPIDMATLLPTIVVDYDFAP